jgi:hypothetical protein
MSLLRSRTTLQVLVGAVVLALVASLGYGLVTSRQAPEPQEVAPPPDMGELGSPPSHVDYLDLGEECDQRECARVVGLAGEGLDAEEAIDAVYTTLMERGYSLMLPPGEDDPDEVDWVEVALTDGDVFVQASDTAPTEDTLAHLIILHAEAP